MVTMAGLPRAPSSMKRTSTMVAVDAQPDTSLGDPTP